MAAFLGLSGLSYVQTQAADAIDLSKKCRLTITANDSVVEDEAGGVTIPVNLYKVADVDVSGNFSGISVWENMEFYAGKAGAGAAEVTADEWLKLAEEAAELLPEGAEPAGETELTLGKRNAESGRTSAGADEEAVIEDLGVGMYLVMPEEVYNGEYTVKYTFTPYLTALPGSEYTLTGAGTDTWNYDTTIGLKAEAEQQYGDLVINKTLNTYNASLGAMTCVFRVTGTYGNGRTYDNVISATLDGNTGSVTLSRIPAGMTVTVTEEYAGGSYEVVGEGTAATTIVSNAAPNYTAAEVFFTNDYDGGNRGGNGITNRFDSNVSENAGPDDNNNRAWAWTKPQTENPQ